MNEFKEFQNSLKKCIKSLKKFGMSDDEIRSILKKPRPKIKQKPEKINQTPEIKTYYWGLDNWKY